MNPYRFWVGWKWPVQNQGTNHCSAEDLFSRSHLQPMVVPYLPMFRRNNKQQQRTNKQTTTRPRPWQSQRQRQRSLDSGDIWFTLILERMMCKGSTYIYIYCIIQKNYHKYTSSSFLSSCHGRTSHGGITFAVWLSKEVQPAAIRVVNMIFEMTWYSKKKAEKKHVKASKLILNHIWLLNIVENKCCFLDHVWVLNIL